MSFIFFLWLEEEFERGGVADLVSSSSLFVVDFLFCFGRRSFGFWWVLVLVEDTRLLNVEVFVFTEDLWFVVDGTLEDLSDES